ncbi:MAG: hypothetical protein AMJ75_08385 [Phycisphaerae bacterium SM1_79]|nr:MAG: hypothetical protein AMJ75_08385 [Phycisphaerae bacterium SM1_79]
MKESISISEKSQQKPNRWLNDYARDVTSQHGEDGIIEKALEVIGQTNQWCVEFGAWDGKTLSNTYNLIVNKGYSAVLMESKKKRFNELLSNFQKNQAVIAINDFVGFEGRNSLDRILQITPIPVDFDLLSIDVDGCDYHIWEATKHYRPKIVIIEFNQSIPASVEFVQPRDAHIAQGSSLLSISKLGKTKGYELVCVAGANGIFVDSKYFQFFGIEDNSVSEMWTDQSIITHIFCGYDGTVFLAGYCKLPWQDMEFRESRVQQLPAWARRRIGDRNIIRRKFGKIYRHLRKRNII